MKNKHSFLLLSGLFLLSLTLPAQDATQSKWHNPEKVSFPHSYTYDEANELFYLFTNDDENLYVNLVMTTDASQIRALRFGLTVYTDPDVKNNKRNYVRFLPPDAAPREEIQYRPDPENPRVGRIDQRRLMASRVNEVEIGGFGNRRPVKLPITEVKEIACDVHIDDQVKLNYQITIPFEKLQKGKEIKQLSIGIESGYLDMEQMAQSRPGMQQRPEGQRMEGQRPAGQRPAGERTAPRTRPADGENRPGAARSPEEREQRRQEMMKLTVPVKVWVKTVNLAKNV